MATAQQSAKQQGVPPQSVTVTVTETAAVLADIMQHAGEREAARIGVKFDVPRAEIVRRAKAAADDLFGSVIDTAGGRVRTAIEDALKQGGRSPIQIADDIAHEYAGVSKRQARTVLRTVTRKLYNETALDTYAAAGLKQVKAIDGLGGLTGKTDPDCLARNGKVFSIEDARLEDGKEHPNGTLSWVPVLPEGGLAEASLTTLELAFDPAKHPHLPRGPHGGQWASTYTTRIGHEGDTFFDYRGHVLKMGWSPPGGIADDGVHVLNAYTPEGELAGSVEYEVTRGGRAVYGRDMYVPPQHRPWAGAQLLREILRALPDAEVHGAWDNKDLRDLVARRAARRRGENPPPRRRSAYAQALTASLSDDDAELLLAFHADEARVPSGPHAGEWTHIGEDVASLTPRRFSGPLKHITTGHSKALVVDYAGDAEPIMFYPRAEAINAYGGKGEARGRGAPAAAGSRPIVGSLIFKKQPRLPDEQPRIEVSSMWVDEWYRDTDVALQMLRELIKQHPDATIEAVMLRGRHYNLLERYNRRVRERWMQRIPLRESAPMPELIAASLSIFDEEAAFDLQLGEWREALHPRDQRGRFRGLGGLDRMLRHADQHAGTKWEPWYRSMVSSGQPPASYAWMRGLPEDTEQRQAYEHYLEQHALHGAPAGPTENHPGWGAHMLGGLGGQADAIVLAYGKEYQGQSLPDGIEWGVRQQCYMNAAHLALSNPEYTYVEGWAIPAGLPFRYQHAWVVDDAGRVIDTTWQDHDANAADSVYVGVPFTSEYLMQQLLQNDYYGILGNAPMPLPDDAVQAA